MFCCQNTLNIFETWKTDKRCDDMELVEEYDVNSVLGAGDERRELNGRWRGMYLIHFLINVCGEMKVNIHEGNMPKAIDRFCLGVVTGETFYF